MSTPPPGGSRAERSASARLRRERRQAIAHELAAQHDGVVTRAMLRAAGITTDQIRGHVEAGSWHVAGWHTLAISGREPTGRGLWWRALWESGTRSVLDGPTALLAAGLTGWSENQVHVSVPNDARVRPLEGVRVHRPRAIGDSIGSGLRRTKPHVAVVRAALWARSDRAAATLVAMTVQQRLTTPSALLAEWATVRAAPRRALLDAVIADVCDGAHSMGELDLARLCRAAGLPPADRQAVRTGPRGTVHLDAWWDEEGVHVEVQGAHHYVGTAVVDDALRANEVVIADDAITLQIPVLALRLQPHRCLDQLRRALAAGRRRRRAA